jgi:hypothetical protein
MPQPVSAIRRWVAAIVVLLLVLAVWKVIDWRMRPPPPPTPSVALP